MEEISHVFLGHQPSRLKVLATNKSGRTVARDYRHADEEAAYATGAAALVPYAALRKFVLDGQSSPEIAKHFRVSRELVEYRLKVTQALAALSSRLVLVDDQGAGPTARQFTIFPAFHLNAYNCAIVFYYGCPATDSMTEQIRELQCAV